MVVLGVVFGGSFWRCFGGGFQTLRARLRFAKSIKCVSSNNMSILKDLEVLRKQVNACRAFVLASRAAVQRSGDRIQVDYGTIRPTANTYNWGILAALVTMSGVGNQLLEMESFLLGVIPELVKGWELFFSNDPNLNSRDMVEVLKEMLVHTASSTTGRPADAMTSFTARAINDSKRHMSAAALSMGARAKKRKPEQKSDKWAADENGRGQDEKGWSKDWSKDSKQWGKPASAWKPQGGWGNNSWSSSSWGSSSQPAAQQSQDNQKGQGKGNQPRSKFGRNLMAAQQFCKCVAVGAHREGRDLPHGWSVQEGKATCTIKDICSVANARGMACEAKWNCSRCVASGGHCPPNSAHTVNGQLESKQVLNFED